MGVKTLEDSPSRSLLSHDERPGVGEEAQYPLHREGQILQQTTRWGTCPVPGKDGEDGRYVSLQVMQGDADRIQGPTESGWDIQRWIYGTHGNGTGARGYGSYVCPERA